MTPKEEAGLQAEALEKKAAALCAEARYLLQQADKIREPYFSSMERVLANASAEVKTWPQWEQDRMKEIFDRPYEPVDYNDI